MDYQAILMAVIAFSAIISVLSVVFHWLLLPVKEDISEIKTELRELRRDLKGK